jgi:tetratricopeptide (TPR) repeat protein
VRTLSVDTIAARIDDRFRLLTHGDKTALPRQHTLRALIDWSHELLTVEERAVFRRLAVFAGWTVEAAEVVTSFGTIERSQVLDHMTQLAEKSLVAVEAGGERYRLLDTVRQYALERLEEAREGHEARTRHLQFYLALAEKARPELAGPRQGEWLKTLDLERENLLAAHICCEHAPGGAELGLKLANMTKPYWFNRGLLALGQRIALEALVRPGAEARTLPRCRGLFDAGQFATYMGRYGEAQRYLEESLAIAREMGDQRRIAVVLQPLGMAYLGQGNAAAARRHTEEALACARSLGEQREIAAALIALAQYHRAQGSLDEAEPLYEEALALLQALDDRENIAVALLNLTMVAIGRRDSQRARARVVGAFTIVEELGSKSSGQSVLEACAGLASLQDDWQRVARFYGAAEAQAAQSGLHRDPADAAFLQPLIARAQAALGADNFAAAESAGRALAYDAAMAEARVWLVPKVNT